MELLDPFELDLYNGKSVQYVRDKYPNMNKQKVYAARDKVEFAKALMSDSEVNDSSRVSVKYPNDVPSQIMVQKPTRSEATEVSLGFIEQFILNCVSDVVTIFKWIYRHPIWTIMLLLILTVVVFVIWLLVDYLMNLRKTNKPVTD